MIKGGEWSDKSIVVPAQSKDSKTRKVVRFRQKEGYNPSLRIQDIKLAHRHYLIERMDVDMKRGDEVEVESEKAPGLVYVLDKETATEIPNVAKVRKRGPECSFAEVGQYVAIMACGGNYHDDKKPQPFCRAVDDKRYMVVHEDNLTAVITCDQQEGWPEE